MRIRHFLTAAVAAFAVAGYAEVPELTALVPEATGYELIAKLDPRTWNSKGYQKDNTETLEGDVKRVGYLLKLTGQDDQLTWVFVSMDPFSQVLSEIAVPKSSVKSFQDYINNLEIFSNSANVKTGRVDKGNIEFWATNYSPGNAKQVPGADDKTFDFGDQKAENGGYGSMQVHNYQEKQTLFSFSNLQAGSECDLGIGNSPAGNPDWTFSKSGKTYKSAELFIVAKIDNMKKVEPFKYSEREVLKKVNELAAKSGWKLLYAYDLRTGSNFGDKTKVNYEIDNSAKFTSNPKRVGYLMLLVDTAKKESWVYAEMDNFAENIGQLGVPVKSVGVIFQKRVDNLVVKSNVPDVKTGDFPFGNIEFWPNNYMQKNAAGVEGASDAIYDFGDECGGDKPAVGHGSMQIHNTAEKQTIFAYNKFEAGANSEVGIGNSPGQHKDWTFSGTFRNYKSGWLFVVVDGE